MKYALWITGILSALALAFPKLVAFAYFLLIVPGVVLTIAPTVFVYLAGTAALRCVVPIESRLAATAVSFGLVLGLGWGVMQPFRASALKNYQTSNQPNVVARRPIELHGRVLIDAPDWRGDPSCNYLCLAILDMPQVKSVTMVTGGREGKRQARKAAAFELQSAEVNPTVGLFPDEPENVVREFRLKAKPLTGKQFPVAKTAVKASWAMRLAGAERLRETVPVSVDQADWVVRIDNLNRKANSKLHQIIISDDTGTVRFRKSYRSQPVPAAMFYVGVEPSFGSGPTSGKTYYVGRQVLTSGAISLHPESELLNAIGFQMPPLDTSIVNRLRLAVKEALNDASVNNVRLDLARRYLGLFFFNAKKEDYGLTSRIIADDRIRDLDAQLLNVFSKKRTPVEMKDAYAERLVMGHTSSKLRRWLAESLAKLPEGTFSNPSPVHRKIWSSPEVFQDAGPFFARAADMKAGQALPILKNALDHAVEIPKWNDRRCLIEGIRSAFVQLGPSASEFAPRLRELFLQRPSPLMNDSGDADNWRFALLRMGVEIKDLPFFPSQSTEMVERISRQMVQRLSRYEQQLIAEANP